MLTPNRRNATTDERERDHQLEQPKLVRAQLQVGAGEVGGERVGVLVGGDPDRRACRLETAAQLLANIGKRSVGDPCVPIDVGGCATTWFLLTMPYMTSATPAAAATATATMISGIDQVVVKCHLSSTCLGPTPVGEVRLGQL